MRLHYKTIAIHAAAWVTYLLILFLGATRPGLDFWINTISTIIPIVILFYFNIGLLFPRYLATRRFVQLAILLVVFNFAMIGFRLVLNILLQQASINSFADSLFSPVMFWNQFRVNLLFIGISFAYWYAKKNYRAEKNQQQLEREILDARLSSLKYQINPHFLYNTLSLIYTKSLPHSRQLADAIAKLSDMMRYSLGEKEEDGKAPLDKEVQHIKNFIGIQQMRFDNKLKVELETHGDASQCRVMPLLLLTFVENAFKHGDLNDTSQPLLIRLNVSEETLFFEIKNKKAAWKKELAHGIGLDNIRNRLQLAYPQKHELIINDADDNFFVNLKIAM